MEPLPLDRRHPLHGRNLRHAAMVVLHRHGSASIGEILEVLWANDFRLTGDRVAMGKRLSDALRHEVRRGRVRRVGWGRYAIHRLARTTRYRILRRWRLALPAECDSSGEPRLQGRAPDDRIGALPWSRHDRDGHQLWLGNGRYRWEIGRHVLGIFGLTQAIERAAAGELPSPGPRSRGRRRPKSPSPRLRQQRIARFEARREAHLAAVCARSTEPAARATRRMAEQLPRRPAANLDHRPTDARASGHGPSAISRRPPRSRARPDASVQRRQPELAHSFPP